MHFIFEINYSISYIRLTFYVLEANLIFFILSSPEEDTTHLKTQKLKTA